MSRPHWASCPTPSFSNDFVMLLTLIFNCCGKWCEEWWRCLTLRAGGCKQACIEASLCMPSNLLIVLELRCFVPKQHLLWTQWPLGAYLQQSSRTCSKSKNRSSYPRADCHSRSSDPVDDCNSKSSNPEADCHSKSSNLEADCHSRSSNPEADSRSKSFNPEADCHSTPSDHIADCHPMSKRTATQCHFLLKLAAI